MLFAAKHRKDHNFKLREDEISSCILGPLSYMPAKEVWKLFRAWLPFNKDMWPFDIPTDVNFSFWPNLKNKGRVEPDLLVRFSCNGNSILLVIFEIKWESPLSGEDELIKQWNALPYTDKQIAFHVYLVKNTNRGNRELTRSLNNFPNNSWRNRLICIGWRSLIEVLLYSRSSFGTAMNLWGEGVIAFLQRRGQTVFTGFEWLEKESVFPTPKNEIFWKTPSWFYIDKDVVPTGDKVFWNG